MTKLLYLEGLNVLEADATVTNISKEEEKDVVILDQTTFYPQGGGQPYDQGVIESEKGKFVVSEVRFVDGAVKHIGSFENGTYDSGDQVHTVVDPERRMFHSRLHSAGHIVDMAVFARGLSWIPGKGYHFPDGPYIEYEGSLEGLDKETLKEELEKLCNSFIEEGRETELRFMPKEEMHTVCHHVPEYLPEGKPARVVLFGDFGVPCGGTHVQNLKEVRHMTIRKIKQEGKNVRVGYDVEK